MDLTDLTEILGYAESPFFLGKPDFHRNPSYSHILRKAERECALRGVYTLGGKESEAAIPVVYLCEADSEEGAAKLHKLVWNQNVVPFMIVSTPKAFRLYPGFKYGTKSGESESQAILRISKTTNEVLGKLSEFKASAIDVGAVWEKWGTEVSSATRVDRILLRTFQKLGERLEKNGLTRHTAHALIGKYVYLYYLRDRSILSDRKFEQWGIEPKAVFGRDATLEGFHGIVEKLEGWLNGSLFPIPRKGENAPGLRHIRATSSNFLGDDPQTRQMHLDFKAYDFEHIPIETLSVVYQQFLHAEGRGRRQGAYYTPVHLVNFILDELDSKRPLRKGMKVFDPACGSGAFLVQSYRLMIEKELAENSKNIPRPSELRDLLTAHIYGMDTDEDACGVTELSLTLTLLDYVDPPDLEKSCYKDFKLPALRNRNIFHCENGFFKPESDFREKKPVTGFDWVVGNPPWKKLSENSAEKSDQSALQWLENNRKRFPVGEKQIAEAFAWKVAEYLSADGLVGLLMPALSLVKSKGKNFRKAFFGRMSVWCVVNFANLRHLLFEGAEGPAAAFFYSTHCKNDELPSRIVSYAPFVVNQLARTPDNRRQGKKLWNVTVDASEIRELSRKDAATGSGLPWKIAMWGSYRDRRLLDSLTARFHSLSEFAECGGLEIHPGLELREENTREAVEHVPEMIGKNELNMDALRNCGRIFAFPDMAFRIIEPERAYLRKRGGMKPLEICRPPHIVVDAARRFAVFSEEFLVVPPRQIGIAGKPSDVDLLKALTLYLNSNFALYHQFMTSTFWGIERDRPDKNDLEKLPIPIGLLSNNELKKWADLHDRIVEEDSNRKKCNGVGKTVPEKKERSIDKLLARLNELVYDVLNLEVSEKWLVEDLLFVRMKLNEGKSPPDTKRAATLPEFQEYAKILKDELDAFLDHATRNQHEVSIFYSDHYAMVKIHRPETPPPARPVCVAKIDESEINREFARLGRNLTRKQGQWIYFERNLKLYEGRTAYFFKPIQRLNWLKSQALLDADEFIAEKLV